MFSLKKLQLKFDTLFLKIEQKLTESRELEDKNAPNLALKPEDPFNFSFYGGISFTEGFI